MITGVVKGGLEAVAELLFGYNVIRVDDKYASEIRELTNILNERGVQTEYFSNDGVNSFIVHPAHFVSGARLSIVEYEDIREMCFDLNHDIDTSELPEIEELLGCLLIRQSNS